MRTSHARASTVGDSFYYAFRGVATGFSDERNFRLQCYYAVAVGLLLLWFRPPLEGSVLVAVTVGLLLSSELANSALERVVDLVSPEANARAGEAKDMAAAAVMLVSFASAGTVLFVLRNCMEREALVGVGGFFIWLMIKRSARGGRL